VFCNWYTEFETAKRMREKKVVISDQAQSSITKLIAVVDDLLSAAEDQGIGLDIRGQYFGLSA